MELQVGQKVKIIATDGRQGYKRTGVISLITKHYIQIQFKNYRECYRKIDLAINSGIELFIKKDKQWLKLVKEEPEQEKKDEDGVKRKLIEVVNIETGEVVGRFKSKVAAGRAICVSNTSVFKSLKLGRVIRKRYVCREVEQ